MAIITTAAPVSGIRGKVGGNIFSANKSGPYLKAWAKGSNPRSQRQTAHRATLVTFSQAWRGLTGTQRDDWDIYAALPAQEKKNSLGEDFSVSGFAWFVGININRAFIGDAQLSDSPTVAVPATPTIESALLRTNDSGLSSVVRLTIGSSGLADNLAVYSKLFNSEGRLTGSQISLHLVTDMPNAGRRVFFQNAAEDRYGVINLGQRIFLEVATQNTDGRQGPKASIFVDATEV